MRRKERNPIIIIIGIAPPALSLLQQCACRALRTRHALAALANACGKRKGTHSHNAKRNPHAKAQGFQNTTIFFKMNCHFSAVVVSAEIGGNHIIRPPVLAVDGSKTVVEKRRWMFGTPAALATREFPFLYRKIYRRKTRGKAAGLQDSFPFRAAHRRRSRAFVGAAHKRPSFITVS